MAKNEAPAEATAPATTDDSRLIQLNVPAGDPSGLEGTQPRNKVIRALAETGNWTRGEIAKHITNLQYTEEQCKAGKKVPYQIVFQATKNIANVKKVERAAAEAPAATEEAAS